MFKIFKQSNLNLVTLLCCSILCQSRNYSKSKKTSRFSRQLVLNLSKKSNLRNKKFPRFFFKVKNNFKCKSNYKFRELVPDVVYRSILLNGFINIVMQSGGRALAERLVYRYLLRLGKSKPRALLLFYRLVSKSRLPLVLNSVRVGGRIYEVPFYLWWHRRIFFRYKLILSTRLRMKKRHLRERLFNLSWSFLSERQGGLLGRRLRVKYRKLVGARGYLHYRWY